MAALELAGKLAILEDALKRLEGELERDENWRALRSPAAADMENAAQRDARDRRFLMALEANPIYRAWKDMHEVAEVLRAAQRESQALAPDASIGAAPGEGLAPAAANSEAPATRPTLAEALQQARDALVEPRETSPAAGDGTLDPRHELPPEMASLIAAEIDKQEERHDSEQEMLNVGQRATEAVDRILAIPTVDPLDAAKIEEARRHGISALERRPLPERAVEKPRPSEIEDSIGHSVPLEAEDLAFLLSPAGPRPPRHKASATPSPQGAAVPSEPAIPPATDGPSKAFLERLVAEAQSAPTRASILTPRADAAGNSSEPPAGDAQSADTDQSLDQSGGGEEGGKPRLSRLLKAWSKP